jgi:hypothetical protein
MAEQNTVLSLKTSFPSGSQFHTNNTSVFAPSSTFLREIITKHIALCITVFIVSLSGHSAHNFRRLSSVYSLCMLAAVNLVFLATAYLHFHHHDLIYHELCIM